MPMTSIGDLSFSHQSIRQTGRLKAQLQDLSVSLATGQKDDLTKALGSNRGLVMRIDQDLARLDGFDRAADDSGLRLKVMQTTLGSIDDMRQTLADQISLPSSDLSNSGLETATKGARQIFDSLVAALNTEVAGRALFAGQEIDRSALAPPETMMADLRTAVAGAGSFNELSQRIDTWFDDPSGGFATMGYIGGGGAMIDTPVSAKRHLDIELTAADPSLKEVLKMAALAALAGDASAGLSANEQKTALAAATAGARSAAAGLVNLQGDIGNSQAYLMEAQAENTAARATFNLTRNSMTQADPFETASELQQVQQNLEIHYAATARLSRLSLANYL